MIDNDIRSIKVERVYDKGIVTLGNVHAVVWVNGNEYSIYEILRADTNLSLHDRSMKCTNQGNGLSKIRNDIVDKYNIKGDQIGINYTQCDIDKYTRGVIDWIFLVLNNDELDNLMVIDRDRLIYNII